MGKRVVVRHHYAVEHTFFHEEVEGVMYRLRELKLELFPNQNKQPIHDYVVVKIVPNFIKSGNKDDLLANQQLAAVLSQLDEAEKMITLKRIDILSFSKILSGRQ